MVFFYYKTTWPCKWKPTVRINVDTEDESNIFYLQDYAVSEPRRLKYAHNGEVYNLKSSTKHHYNHQIEADKVPITRSKHERDQTCMYNFSRHI